MNARQYQKDFCNYLSVNPPQIEISLHLCFIAGNICNMIGHQDNIKNELSEFINYLFLWCETHDCYLSFDAADSYITELQDRSTTIGILGLLMQNFARILTLEESEGKDSGWMDSGQRMLNNFALIAKHQGLEYQNIIADAYASIRDT